ncbi:MAG: alpha-1,2-fucosyltransferase [Ignavibacteria bacterium]|nr:alpha-1,2-fucosyltransferase [Ignavibacteria bacterium]
MIIVQLIGGLGNQMFQYAFARSLSLKRNIVFKLDITGFEKYKLHKYSLNKLNIIENIATTNDLKKIKTGEKSILSKLLSFDRIKPYFKRTMILEKYPSIFDRNITHFKDNSYFKGYWQNEKYFDEIKDLLLDEFTVKNPLHDKNNEIAEKITNCNSVSIHLRRGDYVNDPIAQKILGTCTIDYYKKGIEYILARVEKPHLFIFSDDIDWAKYNINFLATTTFVDHNSSETNYEDLRLMYLCKHNIIANSSFSWWGAWLNRNKSKIIVAPQNWYKNEELNSNSNDLIPNNWIKI